MTLVERRDGRYVIERDGDRLEDPISSKQDALPEFRRSVNQTNRGIELERQQSRDTNSGNRRGGGGGLGGGLGGYDGGGGFFSGPQEQDRDEPDSLLFGDPFGDPRRDEDDNGGQSIIDRFEEFFRGGER